MTYSGIHIIYNPKSTGRAAQKAKRLAARLKKLMEVNIELIPTRKAGHAIELAKKIACNEEAPLIVSVSGDGGYHEVINGVMQAVRSGMAGKPVVAVEAAGNANDHYHYARSESLLKAIRKGGQKTLTILEVIDEESSLFAHSYWGLGYTAKTIDSLNKKKLNPINEKVLIAKELADHRAVKVTYKSKQHQVNNIIAAKIPRMAKVIKLQKDLVAPPPDQFWLLIDEEKTRVGVVKTAIKGALGRLNDQSELKKQFTLTVDQDWVMQLDGEVYPVKAGDRLQIKVASEFLMTI